MLRPLLGLAVVLAFPGLALAGKFNEVLSIGDAAPAWENLPGVDDNEHSLADLADKDVVVVVFTCNTCPVAVEYEDRLIAFAQPYAAPDSRVAVVAINCNKVQDDLLPAMKVRAEAKQFPFAYLSDESQQIGRDFGAVYTPEFYVLNRDRQVVYMGAMDDDGDPAKATVDYVAAAVTAALEGSRPETTETRARGCRVRYKRMVEEDE